MAGAVSGTTEPSFIESEEWEKWEEWICGLGLEGRTLQEEEGLEDKCHQVTTNLSGNEKEHAAGGKRSFFISVNSSLEADLKLGTACYLYPLPQTHLHAKSVSQHGISYPFLHHHTRKHLRIATNWPCLETRHPGKHSWMSVFAGLELSIDQTPSDISFFYPRNKTWHFVCMLVCVSFDSRERPVQRHVSSHRSKSSSWTWLGKPGTSREPQSPAKQ